MPPFVGIGHRQLPVLRDPGPGRPAALPFGHGMRFQDRVLSVHLQIPHDAAGEVVDQFSILSGVDGAGPDHSKGADIGTVVA